MNEDDQASQPQPEVADEEFQRRAEAELANTPSGLVPEPVIAVDLESNPEATSAPQTIVQPAVTPGQSEPSEDTPQAIAGTADGSQAVTGQIDEVKLATEPVHGSTSSAKVRRLVGLVVTGLLIIAGLIAAWYLLKEYVYVI